MFATTRSTLIPRTYFARARLTTVAATRPSSPTAPLAAPSTPSNPSTPLDTVPELEVPPPLPAALPEASSVRSQQSIQQPVGAFRGGLIGFLLGLTAVGTYGYYSLLSDYSKASQQLLLSVQELQESTRIVTSQLDKINQLEDRIQRLEPKMVDKKELKSMREEYKRLTETQHLDLINLKAHVWSIEQDLVNLDKRNQLERKNQVVTVRI
ncbi:uncharacterized protein JCM15063_005417 [Sporobolomyces koalae]|uniref:uncharacterized protein n=1 Tax=Sporobolomyces koalae TaxID=500713 RepID=UPI00316B45FC